jgi:anti-anti-sigma factor
MEQGSVLHASHEGVHLLRFLGDIRYPLSPSVDRFLQRLFAAGLPAGFVVDLTETKSIDSTNLGLIARIAERMRKEGGSRVTIVCDQPDINEVLIGMGFDAVFRIVESSEPLRGEVQVLAESDADRGAVADIVLEAHRTLMAMNEHNREMFRDVVAAIEQERTGNTFEG